MRSAEVQKGKYQKVEATMAGARVETETALNVSIQHVLDRCGLKPHQVRPSLHLGKAVHICLARLEQDQVVDRHMPGNGVCAQRGSRPFCCFLAALAGS